jgi:membrane protease subunit HflK
MMQSVLGSAPKVVVDQKAGGGGNLLYLPLDKLLQQSGPASGSIEVSPPTSAPRTTAPEPQAPADAAPRSRDALRGRER